MNKLIMVLIVLTMFAASIVMAEDCSTAEDIASVEERMEIKTDVPGHLKGARICVFLKGGGDSCVPAEKFKVVPRKQQFIVTKTQKTNKVTCSVKVVEMADAKEKNRVSLLGGQGPKYGLQRSSDGSKVTVESNSGLIGGAQYQRLLDDKLSVGAQVQSNESVLVNIGLDF